MLNNSVLALLVNVFIVFNVLETALSDEVISSWDFEGTSSGWNPVGSSVNLTLTHVCYFSLCTLTREVRMLCW